MTPATRVLAALLVSAGLACAACSGHDSGHDSSSGSGSSSSADSGSGSSNGASDNSSSNNSASGSSSDVYARFTNEANASGIDLGKHPTYGSEYVDRRAHLFCTLLADGNFTKLSVEITMPPVENMLETTTDRPRLETAIADAGVPAYCPENGTGWGQWRATNVR